LKRVFVMTRDSLFYFVSYLAAHKLRMNQQHREQLLRAWEKGLRPTVPQFFKVLPEFQIFADASGGFWSRGADEIARWQERGTSFVSPGEVGFPRRLLQMDEPPWVLAVHGPLDLLHEPSLAVVGAREPLEGSLHWMQEHLGFLLQRAPLPLASGGARGVDQMAHRLCLRYERPTLVFLPAGLANLYPKSMEQWKLPVLQSGGAFVSEFHPRATMRKWHFQMRNRLIAGVSKCTLVVEARHRSGTWLTAKLALEMGRPLGVLPGSAIEPRQSGNLLLINEGATSICDAQDLVMFLKGACQDDKTHGASLGQATPSIH
jgi:DNA processing protein